MKLWIAAAVAGLALSVAATADDIGKKVTDPVNMKSITVAKETLSIAVNGNKLYFSDEASRAMFIKAPETYIKTQIECPVRGLKGKANKNTRVLVNNEIVYLCCAGCTMGFKKEPNTYVSKLIDPVSKKEFNLVGDSPKVEHKGAWFFFESEESKAAFEKDPAKFAVVVQN